jgi:GNAT superfamily N-acetyltransferase
MVIRVAISRDLAAIANLHSESWRTAYRGILTDDYLDGPLQNERLAIWHARFLGQANERMFVIAAEQDDQLVGFACAFRDEHPLFGSFLDNLHVAPPVTGRGIGRQLLSETARYLVTSGSRAGLYFWVFEQNRKARRFYEKTGALQVESAENPMPDGQRVSSLRYYWPDPATLILPERLPK